MSLTYYDLGMRFGDVWLFRHLTIHLKENTVTALVGPSGSGKTTLLQILSGSLLPTEGDVNSRQLSSIASVFQTPIGVPQRTALDHVVLPLLAAGWLRRPAESEAMGLLASLHVVHVARRPFREISGGEAQRVLLARALASKPNLLLVDEPTAQLDRSNARMVRNVIGQVARTGTHTVVATHDLELAAMCHSVIEISSNAT